MRLRPIILSLAVAGSVLAVSPAGAPASGGQAAAAHRVSINAFPNPAVAGDPVVIFGRLTGPNPGNQQVVLWHRINPAPRFTIVQRTRTDANGFYECTRAAGVVNSNRNWYAVAAGARSPVVHERVQASLVLHASTANGNTQQPVVFSGHITPAHAGQAVVLQRQVSDSGDGWQRLTSGRIGAGGNFAIPYRFRQPQSVTVRGVFPGDRRNIRSFSSPVSLEIQQAQNPMLTLTASADPITGGQSVGLSGMLAGPGNANQPVVLFAATDRQSPAPVAQTTTDASGNYSFTQAPVNSTRYHTVSAGHTSALLFEGVRDAVSISASASSGTVGQTVTFTGTVLPFKGGRVINLQLRNPDGDFQTIQKSVVSADGSYTIAHRLQSPGTKVYRVEIDGGPENESGASAPVTVTVAPAPANLLTPGLLAPLQPLPQS